MKALRNAALAYADRGWKVLPLRPGRKEPLGALVPNGKDQATDDLAQVLRWWTSAPKANVGLSCGPSGWVALDVDPRNGGDDTLADLEAELGELPLTIEGHSGGGGRHLLFNRPDQDLVGVAGPGLDVKDRGYIVAPPSIHPSGRPYVWSVDGDPDEVELADLPQVWLDRLKPAIAWSGAHGVKDSDDPLRQIPAAVYVARLTGRKPDRRGQFCCPFHKEGKERNPSLAVSGTVWACGSCAPIAGKQSMGGDIYDFAGLLRDKPLPLRGPDFAEIQTALLQRLR